MTTTSNYDIASMTAHKRASIRQELTEHWDHTTQIGVEEHATSNVMVAQFIETAINGLDAVDRVDALAQKLLTEGGPINTAVATEIINALRGI